MSTNRSRRSRLHEGPDQQDVARREPRKGILVTPKRKEKLKRAIQDEIIVIQTNIACGKLIPRLENIVTLYKRIEEVLDACPTEPG